MIKKTSTLIYRQDWTLQLYNLCYLPLPCPGPTFKEVQKTCVPKSVCLKLAQRDSEEKIHIVHGKNFGFRLSQGVCEVTGENTGSSKNICRPH